MLSKRFWPYNCLSDKDELLLKNSQCQETLKFCNSFVNNVRESGDTKGLRRESNYIFHSIFGAESVIYRSFII